MKLGFIGFGEVGFELGKGLRQSGLGDIFAFDPMLDDERFGKLVRSRAEEAGVTLLASPAAVIRQVDVIIAAVPGSQALSAAQAAARSLVHGQIYADVSTSTAAGKKKAAQLVEQAGARFVDGAMMGGLSMQHHKVPTLLSGSGSDELIRLLTPFGMVLTKVSDTPGDAIAIKLVRSIAMKGLAALATETLEAAVKLGVSDEVLHSVADTLTAAPFKDTLDWLVTASAVHATRQVHEMNDVLAMLTEIGVDPAMTRGTIQRLQWLESQNFKDRFQGKKPKEWQEVATDWRS